MENSSAERGDVAGCYGGMIADDAGQIACAFNA